MKKFLRVVGKTVEWIFIVFCIYVASLFFRDQRIPKRWLTSICDRCSTTNLVIRCEKMAFGFRHGLRAEGIKLFDRTKPNALQPVLSASDVNLNILTRHVRVNRLKYPRLPESYYTVASTGRTGRVEATLPKIRPFTLELHRPSILGIEPERVVATVKTTTNRFDASDIRLTWPDAEHKMVLNGFTYVDFGEQRVYGEVLGEARQSQIRPLLVALDVPVSLPYMDAFTGVVLPVPAFCSWDVALTNSDFRLNLDLHPTLGSYNGVPMKKADGKLSIHVLPQNGHCDFETTVGPLTAIDTKGRRLEGQVVIRGTNDIINVHFDAGSQLELKDTLAVIDYLNDGTLDCLTCETAPSVTVKGMLATDVARQAENNLSGTLAFERGTFFGMPVKNAKLDYGYVGDTVFFSNVTANAKQGGFVTGNAHIHIPGLDPDRATFDLNVKYKDGALAELADLLSMDFGDRHGTVNSWIELSAPFTTNLYPHLNAKGAVKITDGRLAQMPLFAGLTRLLADKVPGVSKIVDFSQASADYTITDGVLHSDDILVEGTLVSIKIVGDYDLVHDDMNFTARVRLLKDENLLGKLIHGVTWPFTKLLLEFRLKGSIDAPKWEYISVLDRVL